MSSKLRKATLVFVLDNDRVLLAKKKRGFGQGKLNGYGGKVEPHETVIDAALRELKEESGIALRSSALKNKGILTFMYPSKPEWNQEVHVFIADANKAQPCETEEMSPAWYGLDEIPYHSMWADDPFWLPFVLYGKSVTITFIFDQSNTFPKTIIYVDPKIQTIHLDFSDSMK